MKNSSLSTYAEQLSDIYMRMGDLKIEGDAIVEAAKEAGIDVKILRRVARELATDSEKLRKKFAAESDLEDARMQLDLFRRKGIDQHDREAA